MLKQYFYGVLTVRHLIIFWRSVSKVAIKASHPRLILTVLLQICYTYNFNCDHCQAIKLDCGKVCREKVGSSVTSPHGQSTLCPYGDVTDEPTNFNYLSFTFLSIWKLLTCWLKKFSWTHTFLNFIMKYSYFDYEKLF